MTDTNLRHHGIIGMKWGVRRSEAELAKSRGRKLERNSNAEKKAERASDLKNRRTLSDADLKRKIERLKLEKQFKELTEENIAPGRKFVSEIMSSAGKSALKVAAAGAVSYSVKLALTKEFDPKDAANYIAANPNKKK